MARSRQAENSREELANQVERVGAELDHLKQMFATFDPSLPPAEISADWIRGMQSARRRREKIFGSALFADPSWDILLELFAVQLEGGRATVTDLCNSSGVPYTTALRTIAQLESTNLIVRTPDHRDRRRIWIDLSRAGKDAMRRYFRDPQAGGAGI